jgi:hypothetical protein
VDMAKPAVGNWNLSNGGGRLLGYLPPAALLTLPTPAVDVLVHGLPHESAGDEPAGRPRPWVSNFMQGRENASAVVSGNDGPRYTSRDVTQDVVAA